MSELWEQQTAARLIVSTKLAWSQIARTFGYTLTLLTLVSWAIVIDNIQRWTKAHDWKIVYKIVYLNYCSFVKRKSHNPLDFEAWSLQLWISNITSKFETCCTIIFFALTSKLSDRTLLSNLNNGPNLINWRKQNCTGSFKGSM